MPEKPTYKQLEARIVQLELELRGYRKKRSAKIKKDARLSTNHFRLAFHTSPDAINISRVSDGTYIDVNDSFAKITGYSREEILTDPSIHLDIWKDRKDRERLEEIGAESIRACRESGSTVYHQRWNREAWTAIRAGCKAWR